MHTSFDLTIYIPINNTYLDMLSSGKTGILKLDIRKKLFDLKKSQDALIKIGGSINEAIQVNIHEVEKQWDMEYSQFFRDRISEYRKPVDFYDILPSEKDKKEMLLGLKYHHNIYNWMYQSFYFNKTIGNVIVNQSDEIIKLIDKELKD